MNRPNITPGPWQFKNTGARIEVATPSTPTSAYAFSIKDEANARAISAIPDMLHALERVFQHLEVEEADGRLGHSINYLNVKGALAKAGYTF